MPGRLNSGTFFSANGGCSPLDKSSISALAQQQTLPAAWRAVAKASWGLAPDADDPDWRFLDVLSILILGDYLPEDTRLACFAASKVTAVTLLQNSQCVVLRLRHNTPLSRKNSKTWQQDGSHRERSYHGPSTDPAQQLASLSENVKLIFDNCLTPPAPCVWPRVTTVVLYNQHLAESGLAALQLQHLPRLQTLRVERCWLDLHRHSNGSKHGPTPVCAATKLVCMECGAFTPLLLNALLTAVDPDKLRTVETDCPGVVDWLARVPSVSTLRLIPASGCLGEHAMEQLFKHPGLTHLELSGVDLKRNLVRSACHWKHLEFVSGTVDVHTIGNLPLAQMSLCSVHGAMRVENSHSYSLGLDVHLDMALRNISACPHVTFVPTKPPPWLPQDWKVFSLDLLYSRNALQAGDAIAAVMARLAHGARGAALDLDNAAISSPEVLAALRAAPEHVTRLVLTHTLAKLPQEAGRGGVLAHVPLHVRHITIVLFAPGGPSMFDSWIEVMFLFMREVRRPMKLSLVHCDFASQKKKAVLESAWPQAMQARVVRWLKACASEHIEVDFRYCM